MELRVQTMINSPRIALSSTLKCEPQVSHRTLTPLKAQISLSQMRHIWLDRSCAHLQGEEDVKNEPILAELMQMFSGRLTVAAKVAAMIY